MNPYRFILLTSMTSLLFSCVSRHETVSSDIPEEYLEGKKDEEKTPVSSTSSAENMNSKVVNTKEANVVTSAESVQKSIAVSEHFSTELEFSEEALDVRAVQPELMLSPESDSLSSLQPSKVGQIEDSFSQGRRAKVSSKSASRAHHDRSASYVPSKKEKMLPKAWEEPKSASVSDVQTSESYTDYGVNPFVEQSKDALSTFSIDVDTASYTIARRKLNEGKLPPTASVRVEEYINFFDYNYDASEASPFTVNMEGMLSPFNENHHILRIGVQGMEYTNNTRPPLHLTFLVDVSGSMSSSDKLPMAQRSMHLMVDTLRPDDTVSLTTYAGAVRAVLEPTSGRNKKEIHQAIDQLSSGGSTAMSSGLDLAYKMAWSSFEEGAENRVVVLSDGDANVGRTSWPEMLQQIKGYADRGVTLSTIGFGMGNYKDTRMEQLANKGDGNNFYIDTDKQANRVFVEDFGSTMISIARDVKIQVEFDDAVESYRLIGYENRDIADKDFRNDRVDAGEVGAGHNVTALYELVLDKRARSSEQLATVRLRYEAPGADKSATERSWDVSVADVEKNSSPSKELRLAYTAGTFAEILRQSPYTSEIVLSDLISYGQEAVRRSEKDDTELLKLMKKAHSLGAGMSVATR